MNNQLEALLNAVSKSELVDKGDLAAASQLILAAVMEGLAVKRSGIWLYQEEGAGISCFYLVDEELGITEENLVLQRKDLPHYFAALDEDRIIAAHDARTAPETCEFTESYLDVLGITSMLDTPIRHSGKTVGIICSEHRGVARTWTEDEMVFAGVLSDLFGRAISAREKLDYEQQLIKTNQNLEALVAQRTEHLQQTIEQMQTLQQQLIESEKLASLGNLVAGMAHEVNTPLGIALTATSHLKDGITKLEKQYHGQAMTREDLLSFLEVAKSAIDLSESNLYRAATLVTNFKRTSADQHHFEHEDILVKSYVEQVLSTLVPITKKKNVQIITQGSDIRKHTQPGAIAQIITNLVNNSCHHGFEEQHENPMIQISIVENDQNKIEIRFKDNGCGINQESLKKIFDPFYTTKRSQGGTGLGLSIVHTLATQNLNGKIEVSSDQASQDSGTEFKIIF
ncbi:MAG: GAF domain-containing sensor histidine kinase [Gammaproteobacteria bacterium]|nr:GAF domain-containing sensor histidine kinase [Gammaproteobacteria bacterium]